MWQQKYFAVVATRVIRVTRVHVL